MSERNWFAAVKGGLFNQVFESDIVLVVNWDICKRPRAIMDDQQSNPKVWLHCNLNYFFITSSKILHHKNSLLLCLYHRIA